MKKIVIIIIVVALIAVGVLVIQKKKEALSHTPAMKEYSMVVSSMKVQKAHHVLTLPYLATVKSDTNVVIASKMNARVSTIVKSGSVVKKGALLVALDTQDLLDKKESIRLQMSATDAEVKAKKLALLTEQESHNRTKALLKVEGASQESYEKEASALETLQASLFNLQTKKAILKTNLSEIQTSLSYARLKAPIDGIVSLTYVNTNDMAFVGKPLLKLESEEGKYLLVSSAKKLQFPTIIYEGKNYALEALHKSLNNLYQYRTNIKTEHNVDDRVNVNIVVFSGEGIEVPMNGVLQKNGKAYVLVVSGHTTSAKEVFIVARGEENLIIKGLRLSDEIVLAKPDILLQLLAGKSIIVQNN